MLPSSTSVEQAIPDPFASPIMLPTRITTTSQSLEPAALCVSVNTSNCSWVNTSTDTIVYVADTELFTVFIDHAFSSTVGLGQSGRNMQGTLLGPVDPRTGQYPTIDPCAAYVRRGLQCPSYVKLGVGGAQDIVAVDTLLEAAGVTSIDAGERVLM